MNILKKLINKFYSAKKTKMECEILEQPDIIFELIKKYVNKDYSINIDLNESFKSIAFIASGSSYNCGAVISEFIRKNININSQVYYSSEIALSENFDTDNETLYVFISQSGETSDTNEALEIIKKNTDKILAVTNTKNSKLYNNANYKILTFAGTEKAIASTKTVSAQLFVLFLLAIKLMQIKKIPIMKYLDELINVPEYIKNTLRQREQILKYANKLANCENAIILASGIFYPLAKECSLKIQEISYINANAYPTGEFLHGHMSILNNKCAVIIFVNTENIKFTIDVLMKINNFYKSDTLIVSALPINDSDKSDFIPTEAKNNTDFLFSSLVMFQLIALEASVLLNRNIDFPQGLSKIVK